MKCRVLLFGCHQETGGFINQSKVVLIRAAPFDKVFPSMLPMNKLIWISLERLDFLHTFLILVCLSQLFDPCIICRSRNTEEFTHCLHFVCFLVVVDRPILRCASCTFRNSVWNFFRRVFSMRSRSTLPVLHSLSLRVAQLAYGTRVPLLSDTSRSRLRFDRL